MSTQRELFEATNKIPYLTEFSEILCRYVTKNTELTDRLVQARWEGWQAHEAQAPVVAEWISVDDRLPECSNGHVWSAPAIVQCDLGIIYKLSYFSGDGDDGCWQRTTNFVDNGSNRIVEWMPLPPAKEK